MHRSFRALLLLGIAGSASLAYADDTTAAAATAPSGPVVAAAPAPPPPPPPPAWKANAELGYIESAGNGVSNQSFHGKLHGEYQSGPWAHEGNIDALSTQSNAPGAPGSEQYTVTAKSKRSFTPLDYLFIQAQWNKDVQSPLDYQAFLSAGYGRYLLKSDTQTLNAEIGAGYRHSEANEVPLPVPPAPPPATPPLKSTNNAIGNFNANYCWLITPALTFTEKVDVQYGSDSTDSHSVTELKQAVSKALAFTLSYDYRRTDVTNTPALIERITTFNLIYQFQ